MTAFTDKEFVSGTTITSTWLNGVNDKLKAIESPAGSAEVGFLANGTNVVTRTVQDKLREFVSVNDFGAVGNGIADDTVALTNFFNSAISRPGIEHRLESKIYAVSAVLPTINVSNVVIKGEGAEIHDVGSMVTGTVIKWIGADGTAGPLVKVSSVSGASNQRVSNVEFSGIGIDCNSGAINYGIEISSIRDSVIDVAVANAGFTGMNINVVASLGEAKDVQRNVIRLKARQVEKRNAFCLTAGGDSVANTSLNEFWVDCQHSDLQAIYLTNVDNNDWRFVRCYRIGGGTATESVSLLGNSSTESQSTRSERFWFFTATVAMRAYGTGTYTYPSKNHSIHVLDKENGTPNPIVDAGASIFWKNDSTPFGDSSWVSFSPIVTAGAGSFSSVSATGYYLKRGKIVHLMMTINCTNVGTASSFVTVTLPFSEAVGVNWVMSGKNNITGIMCVGAVQSSSNTMNIQTYNGSFPIESSQSITMSGFYAIS